MNAWLEDYEQAGLLAGPVPEATARLAAQASVCATSRSRRAVESLARLRGPSEGQQHVADAVFREAGLRCPAVPFLRLPAQWWALLARLAWFGGWTCGVESWGQVNRRAAEAARVLDQLALRHGSVFLLGHGIMNRLIAFELKKLGYATLSRPSSQHWGCLRCARSG